MRRQACQFESEIIRNIYEYYIKAESETLGLLAIKLRRTIKLAQFGLIQTNLTNGTNLTNLNTRISAAVMASEFYLDAELGI
jgi:hypothetical protein